MVPPMMVLVRQARHDATFSRQSAAGGDQAENGLEQYTVRFHPATGLADVTCFTGGGETLVLLDARMLSPGTSECVWCGGVACGFGARPAC